MIEKKPVPEEVREAYEGKMAAIEQQFKEVKDKANGERNDVDKEKEREFLEQLEKM